MSIDGILRDKLKEFKPNESVLEKYAAFSRLISEAWCNLTAIKDDGDIAVKHFADSLSGMSLISENAKVLDVGSGAGFPAVPIAAARPDLQFTLVESNGKKAAFLIYAASRLDIKNIEVINERAETLARTAMRESFDYVTARAVAPLTELAELTVPFLKIGGKLLAYKGGAESVSEDVLSILGARLSEIFPFKLDGKYDRNIFVIEKTKETDAAYPRSYKKIRTKSLTKELSGKR